MASTIKSAARFRVFNRPRNPDRQDPNHRLNGTRHSNFLRLAYDLIPGVIYGYDQTLHPPQLIGSRRKDILRELDKKKSGMLNTIYDLQLEDGSRQLAIPRDIKLHVAYSFPVAMNWLRYDPKLGASMQMRLQYTNVGLAPGTKRGGQFNVIAGWLWVHVKGDTIPFSIPVDAKNLEVGERICWHELDIPDTIRLIKRNPKEKETVLCNMQAKYSIIKEMKAEKNAEKVAKWKAAREEKERIMLEKEEKMNAEKRERFRKSQEQFKDMLFQE